MNDEMAEQTIEDHKYLLEHVENRCAIAYFACANRNLSLFNALNRYFVDIENQKKEDQSQISGDTKTVKTRDGPAAATGPGAFLERTF